VQFRLPELSNYCKTFYANALRPTRWHKPTDPPSFRDLDFEEECLEISNTLTINHVEDFNQTIALTTTVVITTTKETQTDSILQEEAIIIPLMLLRA